LGPGIEGEKFTSRVVQAELLTALRTCNTLVVNNIIAKEILVNAEAACNSFNLLE